MVVRCRDMRGIGTHDGCLVGGSCGGEGLQLNGDLELSPSAVMYMEQLWTGRLCLHAVVVVCRCRGL